MPPAWKWHLLTCHCVEVELTGSMTSTPVGLSCGVPQGTILGPLLFIMYMTPLAHKLDKLNQRYHFYSDDLQLWSPTANAGDIARLEQSLKTVSMWLKANSLALNTRKTQMLCTGKDEVCLRIDDVRIRGNENVTNLGMVINGDLSVQETIASLSQKCYCFLRDYRIIRNRVGMNTAIMIANAFVQSRLDYANAVYLNYPDYQIKQMQKIQNHAARITLRVGKFSPISERMLTTLHWLPIAQRIKYKVLCTVHKIMYGASPGYQHELILHGPGNRSANLKVIRFNRHKAKTAFSVGAPFIWNALPVMLKTEAKFAVFKRNLKTHLFREKLN